MFYFNFEYLIIMLPALFFASWASSRVNSTFKKYQDDYSRSGMSGAEAARKLLDLNGLTHIRIEAIPGKLTDHYDPKNNVIRLSSSVYNSRSTAAIGVACHEVGHALQYANNYFPIKVRNIIIPITNFGSKLVMPLILIGFLLSYFGEVYAMIAYVGVAFFAFSVLFQLVTLPVEYNASSRAIKAIDEYGFLYEEEIDGARKVLNAAALTYVAALATSLAQLMYLLRLENRIRRD